MIMHVRMTRLADCIRCRQAVRDGARLCDTAVGAQAEAKDPQPPRTGANTAVIHADKGAEVHATRPVWCCQHDSVCQASKKATLDLV